MRRTTVLAVLATALLAGAGCKKKPPPAPPPPPQSVEVRLQVTSISPSTVAPNTPTPAKIYGSAFQDGAFVIIQSGESMHKGTDVRVDSANTLSLTVPGLPAGTYDVKVTNPDGEASVLRSGLTVRALEVSCKHTVVNFEFDSSAIRSDAKSVLDTNMGCYQQATGAIRVEGHADERGTVDYNLALGQRRADSVKQYLVGGGVSASRISTTSYGEERPVDRGSNEAAWAKNRRAEILVSE